MRRIRTLDIIASFLVVLLVGITLVPALARLQRSPAEAKCQSNLHQWAQAMTLYLADNHHFYPTNKALDGTRVTIAFLTTLNQDGTLKIDPATGQPRRFERSINWVEALYPYIWASAQKTGQNWKSFRYCPHAGASDPPFSFPITNNTAVISYVLNGYLIEQPEGIIGNSSNLMMMREIDLTVNSILRPSNVTNTIASSGSVYGNTAVASTNPPANAFLTVQIDRALSNYMSAGQRNPNLHGAGSYILFADGHVKWFSTSYMTRPASSNGLLAAIDSWEANESRWYNYNSTTTTVSEDLRKTIAITP